jgi:signal transduction histidine kinase/CheY-like chemotaxis protein
MSLLHPSSAGPTPPGVSRQARDMVNRPVERKWWHASLGAKLAAAFLLIALIPLTLVSVAAFRSAESTLEQEATTKLRAIARGKARQIESYLLDRKRSVMALARTQSIADALMGMSFAYQEGGIGSGDYEDLDQLHRPYLKYFKDSGGFHDLFLISPDGDVIFSVNRDEDLGTNVATGPYRTSALAKVVAAVRNSEEARISDFEYSPTTNEPASYVGAAVRQGGKFVGVVVAQLTTEEIWELVQDTTGLGYSGETIIGVQVGEKAVFVAPSRHDPYAAFRRRVLFHTSRDGPLLRAVTGDSGEGLAMDYRGRKVLASWMYLPLNRWGMVVKIDADEAFAPVKALRKLSFGIAGVAALLVLAMTILLTRTMARALQQLTRATQLIARGNLSVRAPINSHDEIGELALNFNAMAERVQENNYAISRANEELRAYRDHLQDLVNERTRELADANNELVRAKESAEDASRAKSQFLANMSHELRTPLNAVIGYSEMLEETAVDDARDDDAEDLRKIRAAGKHLLGLINDILDLSKIEAGKMQLYIEDFDVSQTINEVVSMCKPLLEKNDNKLDLRLAPNVGIMHSDAVKVRQSLFNLLSNASKFTEKGTITLSVDVRAHDPATLAPGAVGVGERGDELVFSVKDSGIGMTPEQLARLFRPFTQADASTTRKYGGTGLGLAITRHFCEMLGGGIQVASEVGQGSTFTFYLPRKAPEQDLGADDDDKDQAAPAQTASSGTGEQPVGDTGELILVIDDDQQIQELTRRVLSREGFRVAKATRGEDGIRLARKLRPAAIILDVMMEGMDGWSVLSALKADPELAAIPVMMFTMIDSPDVGYALGAQEYLVKPIERVKLIETLNRVVPRTAPGKPSALVVEDDPATAEMLVRLLEADGYVVRHAGNGALALDAVKTQRPDVVLLDLMMPVMDGFEFAETLTATLDPGRTIPIIVVTARELSTDDFERLRGSVNRIVRKGDYGPEEIRAVVRRALSRSHAPLESVDEV